MTEESKEFKEFKELKGVKDVCLSLGDFLDRSGRTIVFNSFQLL